jgi:hypothetical protein
VKKLVVVLGLLLACNKGTGTSGGPEGEGGAGNPSNTGGAPEMGGFGGSEVPGCNTEGVCRLYSGETCGYCPDCPLGIPECGACGPDPTCGTEDACTCQVCEQDCINSACNHDGVCVYYSEGCQCEDCTADPVCSWFKG